MIFIMSEEKYKIPLFKLNFDKKEESAAIKTIRSRWISSGPRVIELENLFSNYIGVKYSLAVTNCTASLHVAMLTAGIKDGDEVLCPSLTFAATVNAIRYVRAVPVFCDIKSEYDLTISPDEIEKNITKRTKAIIVMHYGGYACNMSRIMKIAKKYGLMVIEDACHAPLSEYKGKKLGSIGDIGCFSFFSNKNISTGEGGMYVTNNPNLSETAKLLRSHGMTTLSYDRAKGISMNYDVLELGYNYRLDDIRASIAIIQLNKLREDILKREKIRQKYIALLKDVKNLIIPFKKRKGVHSNYIFVVLVSNREKVREYLSEKGIQTSIHYPPVHKFKIYKRSTKNLPVTENVTNRLLTLPMYSSLTSSEVEYICKCLKQIVK